MREVGSYPIDVLSDHELEPGERLTLITMYSRAAQGSDTVWESARELADLLGYSTRAIQKHIRAIGDRGWIEAVSEADPRGGGRFHGYKLLRPLGKRRASA